jgi:hypothetical protein
MKKNPRGISDSHSKDKHPELDYRIGQEGAATGI